jgi:anti-sigma factor RsiW
MSACPDKELLLHALADGELDAGNAVALEAHVASCAGCAAELADIRALKRALADARPAYAAPASLAQRIEQAIASEEAAARPAPPRRRFAVETWVLGGSISALAASLALFVLMPAGPSIESQLVDGQLRSLQAAHLVDVVTSNRHVVKPWFNGRIDFAPPVVELADQGFPLAGGRLDHLAGRAVAALVYRRHAHVINVFVWPGDAAAMPQAEHRDGYTLIRWGQGGLVFWAVSDVDPADLSAFQKLFTARVPT